MSETDAITIATAIIVIIICGGIAWATYRNKKNDDECGVGE